MSNTEQIRECLELLRERVREVDGNVAEWWVDSANVNIDEALASLSQLKEQLSYPIDEEPEQRGLHPMSTDKTREIIMRWIERSPGVVTDAAEIEDLVSALAELQQAQPPPSLSVEQIMEVHNEIYWDTACEACAWKGLSDDCEKVPDDPDNEDHCPKCGNVPMMRRLPMDEGHLEEARHLLRSRLQQKISTK